LLKSLIFLLILDPVVIFIIVSGILKSSTIIVEHFSLQICQYLLHIFSAPIFGTYMFIIVKNSCWVHFVNIYNVLYLPLHLFELMSLLTHINTTFPPIFCLSFPWTTLICSPMFALST
jgi:hypothetical protein